MDIFPSEYEACFRGLFGFKYLVYLHVEKDTMNYTTDTMNYEHLWKKTK